MRRWRVLNQKRLDRMLIYPGLFVCHACNWEIERSQPWLYEVEKNEDENAHHWSHDLVLIANPELLGVSLSVEEPTDTPVQQISRILQDLQLKEGSRPVNQHIWSNGDTTNQVCTFKASTSFPIHC